MISSNKRPVVEVVDGQYWEGLREGVLRIQRCGNCSDWLWPPRWRCGGCGSWSLEWRNVEICGTVFAYCHTIHKLPAPAAMPSPPFYNVLIELPQAGHVRLLGILAEDSAVPAVGSEVIGIIRAPEVASDAPLLVWRVRTGART